SPDHSVTMVYDPTTFALWFVTNSSETTAGDIALTNAATMALFSPDGNTIYAAEPNLPISGQRAGGVEVSDRTSLQVTKTYDIPSARYIALSTNGNYLLVFADNSDSVFL